MKITIYKDIYHCYEISTDEHRAAEEVVSHLLYAHNRFIVDTEYKTVIRLDTNYYINIDYERSQFDAVRQDWNDDVGSIIKRIRRDYLPDDFEIETIEWEIGRAISLFFYDDIREAAACGGSHGI